VTFGPTHPRKNKKNRELVTYGPTPPPPPHVHNGIGKPSLPSMKSLVAQKLSRPKKGAIKIVPYFIFKLISNYMKKYR
jgi:hypothetical protein